MNRMHLPVLVILLLSAIVSPLPAGGMVRKTSDEIAINLKGIDGKRYDTSKMRGNILVVSFGATWCQPCHEELQDLEILHLEFKDRPVRFLWVSVDDSKMTSDGELRDFAREVNFTFPVLRDPEKQAYKLFSQRTRVPLVVIIDKDGRLVAPLQFGASSQPGVFRIRMRNRLKDLFAREQTMSSSR
jgi:peroxiredoxin